VLRHVVSEYGRGPEITVGLQKDSYGQAKLEQVNFVCIAHALVTVDQRMVLDQPETLVWDS